MVRKINSVAVIGGGTMGSGIAGLCAQNKRKVLLLDISEEAAKKALDRIVGHGPDESILEDYITIGTIQKNLDKISEYDWICEAVAEDLEIKRSVFDQLESVRKNNSIVSTNTSGIPLRDIIKGMPKRLRNDVAVTHFFNPVNVMKLMELVPGENTKPDVIESLRSFCGSVLGKGVVNAKDTVNFIGNRIGCYWILAGLHHATEAMKAGFEVEEIDALISGSMSLPPTGIFGLVDLIGLDVMELVGNNLRKNLPKDDLGYEFTRLPSNIQNMANRGQIGRKAGGGFYRASKNNDGTRKIEVFDIVLEKWREKRKTDLKASYTGMKAMLSDDREGRLLWQIMGETLVYAADLIPEISDDLVGVDRAMRWGYGWDKGPFEVLDKLNPRIVVEKLTSERRILPTMLDVLKNSEFDTFYVEKENHYLGLNGKYEKMPPEPVG